MEFSIASFTENLKRWFLESPLFPMYEIANNSNTAFGKSRKQSDRAKHPNRYPTHLKEVAQQCFESSTIVGDSTITFDYGNVVMESNYPHYHILENTQVIRKRGKGTTKSKGSEDMYKIKAHRDYERVYWNGKTFTKEYARNVRGSRNRMGKVSHWGIGENLTSEWQNGDSNSYWNVHYRYIENILDNDVIFKLADTYGLKVARKEETSLTTDFAIQEGVDEKSVIEVFDSFR